MSELDTFLDAPCAFCGYNGPGYYQEGTHAESCPWSQIGGRYYRVEKLSSVLRAQIAELRAKLAEAEARAVVLQKRLSALVANPVVAGMSARIAGDAQARDRPDPYLAAEDSLMNGVTEEAQALLRLVEAATNPRLREQVNHARLCIPVFEAEFTSEDDRRDYAALLELISAVDALQAARSGRGEGE